MLKHIPFYASLLDQPLADGKKATNGHVLVYGSIEAHSMGAQGCIASNQTIADETGMTVGSVANVVSHLSRAGWIEVTLNGLNQRVGISPMLTLHLGMKGGSSGDEGGVHLGMNIEDSYRNNKKINKKVSKSTVDFGALPEDNTPPPSNHKPKGVADKELIALVNSITGRDFRVLPSVGVKKTTDSFTLAEIESALRALVNDDWHKEKLKEFSISYFIRSTTIDRFLAKSSEGGSGNAVKSRAEMEAEFEAEQVKIAERNRQMNADAESYPE